MVPFSKIKVIEYNVNKEFCINYKTSGTHIDFSVTSIAKSAKKKVLPTPSNLFNQKLSISKEKKDDIQSLLIFLPEEDKKYLIALLKLLLILILL